MFFFGTFFLQINDEFVFNAFFYVKNECFFPRIKNSFFGIRNQVPVSIYFSVGTYYNIRIVCNKFGRKNLYNVR
jgi:hypothetical protein